MNRGPSHKFIDILNGCEIGSGMYRILRGLFAARISDLQWNLRLTIAFVQHKSDLHAITR